MFLVAIFLDFTKYGGFTVTSDLKNFRDVIIG